MTINFFTRQRGKEKRLYARLTHEHKTTEILLDYAFGTQTLRKETYCNKVKKELSEIFNAQLLEKRASDVMTIKQIFLTENRNRYLLDVFKDYVDKKVMPRHANGELTQASVQKYNVCYNHLKDFLQCRNLDDININNVDVAFVDEFESFLKQFNKHNSTVKHLTYFRCIMNYARRVKGYIMQNPFDSVELKKKKHIPVFLTWTEIESLANKKYLIDRLEKVRDLFLFQCFTGLSYADMVKLKSLDLKSETITLGRQKSNEIAIVYLYDMAKLIWKKYNGLPMLSNVKLNAYLKELAVICGIQKKLTTHVARHTFATTVNLNNGVPLKIVQALLGHSSVKQTEHYAQLMTDTLVKACRDNNNKMVDFYQHFQQITLSSQDSRTHTVIHH